MDKQHKSQFEINDLIDDAVNNAIARRSQVDSELSALSDEEVENVAGGLSSIKFTDKIKLHPDIKLHPTILGYKCYCPPITVGIIAPPDDIDHIASIKKLSL